MFPYAGAYKIHFFSKDGTLKLEKTMGYDDFEGIGNSFKKFDLTKEIEAAPGRDQNDTMNCWDADFVEIGGGVYGEKHSETGEACYGPDDAYSTDNAIYTVIVEDLLTGDLIYIPMVYPIVYLNRVYISKLKLYEHREYCCYEEFPPVP